MLFLCRSGGRSHNAAMIATQAGYAESYNVLEGFEGDKDAAGIAIPRAAGGRRDCRGRQS